MPNFEEMVNIGALRDGRRTRKDFIVGPHGEIRHVVVDPNGALTVERGRLVVSRAWSIPATHGGKPTQMWMTLRDAYRQDSRPDVREEGYDAYAGWFMAGRRAGKREVPRLDDYWLPELVMARRESHHGVDDGKHYEPPAPPTAAARKSGKRSRQRDRSELAKGQDSPLITDVD